MGDVQIADADLVSRWRDGNSRLKEAQARLAQLGETKTQLEADIAATVAEISTIAIETRAVRDEAWRALAAALDGALEVPAEPADAVP